MSTESGLKVWYPAHFCSSGVLNKDFGTLHMMWSYQTADHSRYKHQSELHILGLKISQHFRSLSKQMISSHCFLMICSYFNCEWYCVDGWAGWSKINLWVIRQSHIFCFLKGQQNNFRANSYSLKKIQPFLTREVEMRKKRIGEGMQQRVKAENQISNCCYKDLSICTWGATSPVRPISAIFFAVFVIFNK